jgi:mono/diheme cytochrome c family protein
VLLVAALSTGQKVGLAAVGGAFIVFALVCSFVIPRRNPNFPGKHVGLFTAVSVAFFLAMISAVLVFGKEKEEKAGAAETPAAATTTTTGATTTSGAAPAVQGNATAGKAVFLGSKASCGSCHTLKAAATHGTVGPNLDQLKPDYPVIVHQVEVGGGPMPAFKGTLTDAQIHDVAAFVYRSTHA